MDFKPHPVQWKALNFDTQFAAAICGSQSGKTTVGAVWAGLRIQEEMMSAKPRPGLIGAPTYKILNQSTLQKFWEQFPHLQQYHKRQESVIEIPYQTKKGERKVYPVFIRSFDRPLTVEGMSPGWAWLDEFGQCDSLAWTVVKTRMTVTGGKIFITTTPYNMGFLHREVYQPVKEGIEQRMSLFNWSAYDLADFFQKESDSATGEAKIEYALKAKSIREHLDNERKALPPEMFASRYLGQFARMTGLVYNVPDEAFIPREDIAFERVIGAIDWGFHHPAVGVYGLLGDKWYVIGEWAKTQSTEEEIIQAARNLQEEFGVSKWYADSAQPQSIAAAKKGTGLYIVPFQKKKKSLNNDKTGSKVSSIVYGVSFIQQLIREGRLKVFDDCVLHKDEFMSYHYPEEPAPGQEDIPEKGNDHFCFPAGTLVDGKPIEEIGTYTGDKDVFEFDMGLTATPDHPVITHKGATPMDTVCYTDVIWKNALFTQVSGGIDMRTLRLGLSGVTIVALKRVLEAWKRDCTDLYMQNTTGRFLMASSFTTLMAIRSIMTLVILSAFTGANTLLNICKTSLGKSPVEQTLVRLVSLLQSGLKLKRDRGEEKKSDSVTSTSLDTKENTPAQSVNNSTSRNEKMDASVATNVVKRRFVGRVPVYALRTKTGTFRVNGVLVSNCDAMRYAITGYAPTIRPQARTPKGILTREAEKTSSFRYQFT